LIKESNSLWGKLLLGLSYVCAILLIGMALTVTLDVCYRAIAGRPIVGVFEITEVLLIGITFLAIAGVQASDQQLSVNILTEQLVGRKKAAVKFLDGIAAMLFFTILLWTGCADLIEALRLGLSGSGMVRIPTAVPLGLVTFGTVCMIVTLLIGIRRDFSILSTAIKSPIKEN